MAKKKVPPYRKRKLDPLSFMHQPHDKYARYVLQSRDVALQMIQFTLSEYDCATIDLSSLELTDDSFVDSRLRTHFSDICYAGKTNTEKPVRVSFIFEHKSQRSENHITEQLNRYISNIWANDLKQNRELSLTIPILIYHGPEPILKETTRDLFPNAPENLLRFIPSFDYVLLDINQVSDDILEKLEYLLLRNILLALKHARDEEYIEQFWKKIIIFAPELRDGKLYMDIFQATVIYMSRVSPTFNDKIEEMDNVLSSAEQLVVKPYVIRLYEEGIEKGIEKGLEEGIEKGLQTGIEAGIEKTVLTFIKNNPEWSDQQIARTFEISEAMVVGLRLKLKI